MPRFAPLLSALLLTLAMPSWADEAEDAFVEANILSIFYHELGHAMIDLMALPVYGQEEDAADVASILMIDELFEPEAALELAYDASLGFAAQAMSEGADPAWWDVHGASAQRFYNTVCLFYGGDPETREGFAEDMELPADRAETCAEEYDLAMASWGAVLDDLVAAQGEPMVWQRGADSFGGDVLEAEIEALNESFLWPEQLTVGVADCDQPNAFYDPGSASITLCTEMEPYLRDLYRASE